MQIFNRYLKIIRSDDVNRSEQFYPYDEIAVLRSKRR